MQVIQMKVSELVVPERNVRIHTEKQIDEFVRSIIMFGQIRPVVVDENNVILAGNGLVEALIKAGKETADVYKITDLSENQKKKLMIADNKIFNLGIENLDTLNSFFEELSDDLDIPGFDEEILQAMVADSDEITEKLSSYGTLDEDEIESIKSVSPSSAPVKSEPIKTNPTSNTEPEQTETTDEDTEEEQNYIVCPKCGEKIWL